MLATRLARAIRLALLLPLALALLLAPPARVARAAETATVADDLHLRAGPGLDYDILALMPAGSTVALTGEVAGDWYGVVFADITGWAFAGGLLPADASPAPPGDLAGPTATVVAAALNVRAAPGLDADLLAVLEGGTRVALVGDPVAADGYSWVPIAVGDLRGWVAADYLAGDDLP